MVNDVARLSHLLLEWLENVIDGCSESEALNILGDKGLGLERENKSHVLKE